ncbi:hypothetical protein FOL47_004245 [Perkinsus chesapeaki]|uniref:Sugar phosphate transporter domain-containing protein n=1 Tax=Perkinsus chesapeaki TaxID=330153 RepID=A0A7J6M3L0_PERCH|nr:hypothetical protein FOL47_004245 [Perkinsus chesapeaki]
MVGVVKEEQVASSSFVAICGYMALNFVTSTSIIWINKLAYNNGFTWATTLTVMHFLVTFIGLCLCVMSGQFAYKPISVRSVLPLCVAFCGFVVFNNLSLQYNTVGTYQLMKVMTTPVIVVIQYICYSTTLPLIQLLALVPICLGVILATATSVEVNPLGIFFGVAGILSTSLYQIWVKTKQDELKCSSQQLLLYQAPLSALMLMLVVPMADDITTLMRFDWYTYAGCLVIASSGMAFLVNLSIFLVIGKTSPISYNVLGHAKLVVILSSGYIAFGEPYTLPNLLGVGLTVFGIVSYTHLKMAQARKPIREVEAIKLSKGAE